MTHRFLRPPWVAIALAAPCIIAACSSAAPAIRFAPDGRTLADGEALTWDFDGDVPASEPAGSILFSGEWTVAAGEATPSEPNRLCQTATEQFPAIQLTDEIVDDFALSARVMPLTGEEDQAAGLIFRVQDRENYYILRANALEKNVSFYKYAGGERSFLVEDNADVRADVWQTLEVIVEGSVMTAYFDGEEILELTDDTFSAGAVGLWTKADSMTCFDDVTLTAAG